MTGPFTCANIPNGSKIEELLLYVEYLQQLNDEPIGFQWNSASSSPTLERIDVNGNKLTQNFNFDHWSITGGMRPCVINRDTGVKTYGTDDTLEGLTLDGSAGNLMVETPTAKVNFKLDGDYYQWLFRPFTLEDTPKFAFNPCASQRGGVPQPRIYVGANEGSLYVNASGTVQLQSASGKQPWTGEQLRSLAFNTGTVEFVIGETLTGTGGATGTIIAYRKSSGTWGTDAVGTVYLKSPGVDTSGAVAYVANEQLIGSVSGVCAKAVGAASAISFTMTQAETYANAIGAGWGICDIHTSSYLRSLICLEAGTFNIQSVLGRGIVDKVGGFGFYGEKTDFESIDSNINTSGTGHGTGVDGLTSISWRYIKNIYGNIYEFNPGINLFLVNGAGYSAGQYRIINRTGNAATTISAVLAEGEYETGPGLVPLTSTYIRGTQNDEIGAVAMIPSSNTGGSDSTYLCDMYSCTANSPSIVYSGGHWGNNFASGPACMASNVSTISNKIIGARLVYVPQS